jgi:hypothetical protein
MMPTTTSPMMIYRGELTTGPAAALRLVLRDLIYEKVLVGPVVIDQIVARLISEPNGSIRVEYWKRGAGWIEAAPGMFTPDEFMPGACRPASARDAARLDIPASELDDVTPFEIELEKHEMSRPRKLYGFLYGTELPTPRARAKLVRMLKERAWDLACRRMAPGHA